MVCMQYCQEVIAFRCMMDGCLTLILSILFLFLGQEGLGGGLPVGDSGREVGALFVYRGGESGLPKGFFCAAEERSNWWTSGLVEHGRLGVSYGFGDYDDDGSTDFLVGSPRAGVSTLPIGEESSRKRRGVGDDPGEASVEFAGAILAFSLPLPMN